MFSLSANSTFAQWAVFGATILAVGLAVGIIMIWAVVVRPKSKKRKRHHRKRHHRQHNPTLAETGGLPPLRDPNQPPGGT